MIYYRIDCFVHFCNFVEKMKNMRYKLLKDKEKYKNKAIKIVEETIDELEPVIKNTFMRFVEFSKNFIEDKVYDLIDRGKNKIKNKIKKGDDDGKKENK